jgi:chemosensory pili system protein ChpE
MTASLFFWAFGLSVTLSLLPGPVTIETVRRCLLGGFTAAVRVRLGALLGSLAWAALTLGGAGLLLRQPPVQTAIGVIGAALLLWMAVTALLPARAGVCPQAPVSGTKCDVLRGLGFALMSPIGGGFWLGMSGQIALAAPGSDWFDGLVVFLSGYVLGHLLYTIVFATGLTWGRRHCGTRLLHWTNLVGGVALAGFGLQLLARTVQQA